MRKITLALIPLALLVAALLAISAYTLDDHVLYGAAYGFEVGESKRQTFDRLKKLAGEKNFTSAYVSGGRSPSALFTIEEIRFSDVKAYSQWTLAIDKEESLLNVVRLEFNCNKLNSIYRHRRLFEGP